ncbi:MAG: hypothetical protein AB2421_08235 [Thermotaleaceae bacterium]
MEELFYSWFKEHKEDLLKTGIATELISEPTLTDNPAIFADHFSSTRMGRVTVWNSGSIEIEVVEQDASETVYYKHLEINEENPRVEVILREYFNRLIY